ncbi:Fe2+-dicitrate sensor, membrane protein [Novimethylophilus kurashikiensis]|uniref:Fe2+-dicitrate sensor, membrane protein n=1 Tax=Novimethylophilus kurashikiensis TaxID=1825523 RepID=A0A2R5F9L0_9PROT|nr:Fe2+-dicitrate sensor, membrane protein [Novimethylophilus kurashikiensis]
METINKREAWNKGKLVGQKPHYNARFQTCRRAVW